MSKFQATVNQNEKASSFASIVKWCNVQVNFAVEWGKFGVITGWGLGKQIGWFVVTTGLVTAIPLMFEIKREYLLDVAEAAQINKLAAEGLTPQEMLYNHGIQAAIEPSVLN